MEKFLSEIGKIQNDTTKLIEKSPQGKIFQKQQNQGKNDKNQLKELDEERERSSERKPQINVTQQKVTTK